MNKTSKTLAAIVLVAAAAFGVSACKWPGAKDKDQAPASSAAVAETTPTAPDASATPPVSDAAAPASAASAAPASGAAPARSTGSGK